MSDLAYHPARDTNKVDESAHRGIIESLNESRLRDIKSLPDHERDEEELQRERDDQLDKDDEQGSDSELFEQLENELDGDHGFDMGNFREMRMEQLRKELADSRKEKDTMFGQLTEITREKELIHITAHEKWSVVHFFHRDFKRCKIMDKHLEKLAAQHTKTRFLKASVENVPFLVTKLEIKVLPCVIAFVDGVAKDKLIGFEEIGNTDSFATATLEWRLGTAGVITAKKPGEGRSIMGFGQTSNQDDDDWDD